MAIVDVAAVTPRSDVIEGAEFGRGPGDPPDATQDDSLHPFEGMA